MISDAKLIANRANAQKSTGPKSEQGKAKSSLNSLKHGLSANSSALLPTEDQNAYLNFCDEIRDDLNPKSPIEYILTERITQTLWRLRRIPTAEAELFNRHNESRCDKVRQANEKRLQEHNGRYAYSRKTPPPPPPEPLPDDLAPAQTLAAQFESHEDKSNPFMRLSRYEAHLSRSYHRDLKLLKQLQKERIANPRLQEDSSSSFNEELQNGPTEQPAEKLAQVFPDQQLPEDQSPQTPKEQNEATDSTDPAPSSPPLYGSVSLCRSTSNFQNEPNFTDSSPSAPSTSSSEPPP